jgi:hypothetical protein
MSGVSPHAAAVFITLKRVLFWRLGFPILFARSLGTLFFAGSGKNSRNTDLCIAFCPPRSCAHLGTEHWEVLLPPACALSKFACLFVCLFVRSLSGFIVPRYAGAFLSDCGSLTVVS